MHAKQRKAARRRSAVAFCATGIVMAAFTIRLVDIQVVNAQEHVENRADHMAFTSVQPLYGTRGSIVDSNSSVLASSTMRYDLAIDPMEIPGLIGDDNLATVGGVSGVAETAEQTIERDLWRRNADQIGAIIGQSGDDIRAAVDDAVAANSGVRWVPLEKSLSTEQYRQLLGLGLSYLAYEPHSARAYPNGAVAGNLLGFIPGDESYSSGLESTQNACLVSTDGESTFERAPGGLRIPGTEETTEPIDGGTLQLTIDTDLSWYLMQLIAEEVENQAAQSGSILVVEAKTGAVKAAAEYPTFDPNDPSRSPDEDRGSRIFNTTFEPGSTFKSMTAAMLLDQGLATPETSVSAGSFETLPGGARVGDAFSHPVHNYTLTGALIDSSNVAISKLGALASPEVRAEYLEKFGVGQVTNIGAQGEEGGYMIPVEEWGAQTNYATMFGQAFTMTMPQVVSAYQVLANDGVKKPLHIVESCTAADGTVTTPGLQADVQIVSEEAADTTIEMLENVALQSSLNETLQVPGYRIATKTGTAQKSDGNGGYKSGVYFTSIVGVVPADDPEYVVMVTLDEPTRVTSSAATAPALQKAITQLMKTSRVAPADSEPELMPKFAD